MLEVSGKYNTAKIFTDVVDNESISQIIELCNQSYVADSQIRLMPDIHAGAGCTIGTTMTIKDKICPNLVGCDVSCGMLTIKLTEKDIDFTKLDDIIRTYVPSGFDIHDTPTENSISIEKDLKQLNCINHINIDRALKSIGTLGGGNHFIEVDKDDDNNLYLVIHTGSRHLGIEIAKYYQELAYKELTTISKAEINNIINKLKAEHKESLIEQTLKEHKAAYIGAVNIPKQLAYVQGNSFDAYIHDMFIAQNFASLNRYTIAEIILKQMNLHSVDKFETIHNYIDVDNMILRKGAVSAQKGECLLIPINMRDGSLLCTGKGNSDWNYSAPHGAGRLMSRSQAKEMFTVNEFQQQMSNVFTTSVNSATLDECPMAYKNINDILNNIEPTVAVNKIIKPVYNFKA